MWFHDQLAQNFLKWLYCTYIRNLTIDISTKRFSQGISDQIGQTWHVAIWHNMSELYTLTVFLAIYPCSVFAFGTTKSEFIENFQALKTDTQGWYICKIVSSLVSNFCISFDYTGWWSGTTTKKVTSKILSKSISRMPMEFLVWQKNLICHKIL